MPVKLPLQLLFKWFTNFYQIIEKRIGSYLEALVLKVLVGIVEAECTYFYHQDVLC